MGGISSNPQGYSLTDLHMMLFFAFLFFKRKKEPITTAVTSKVRKRRERIDPMKAIDIKITVMLTITKYDKAGKSHIFSSRASPAASARRRITMCEMAMARYTINAMAPEALIKN